MQASGEVYHLKSWWYPRGMPTSRRRYQVTETDEVAHALNEAAKRWPGEPRSRLIVRAITAGGEAIAHEAALERRVAAIRRTQGSYPDAFGAGYLAALRSDWPA